MLGSLDAFDKEISQEVSAPFDLDFRVNEGASLAGHMGSSQRRPYTCLGNSHKLASKLEDRSSPRQMAVVIRNRYLVRNQRSFQ